MNTPNVMRKRMILDPTPVPVPYQGHRHRERSPRTIEYTPKVRLLTGSLPSDEGSGLKKLVTGDAVDSPGVRRQKRIDRIVGDVLGGLAMLLVVNLWLSLLVGLIGVVLETRLSFFGDGAVVIALYGVHILGIPGAMLSDRRWNPGVIAISTFWLSFLGIVPVGYVVMELIRLIGG